MMGDEPRLKYWHGHPEGCRDAVNQVRRICGGELAEKGRPKTEDGDQKSNREVEVRPSQQVSCPAGKRHRQSIFALACQCKNGGLRVVS